jgi:hypothetical protein
MTTPEDVAKWMLSEIEEQRELLQADAVSDIQNNFGDEFVYENENGNMAIAKNVLSTFKKLTKEKIVWERGAKYWRFREKYDDPR